MIQSLLIAKRGEIACRIIRTVQILPHRGRGTMRSMVEGQVRVEGRGAAGVTGGAVVFLRGLPLDQLRWSPSPFRGGF